jgi:nucleoside-diphosphate kinase
LSVERTLVLVKPDGVQRGLCGEVIRRLEAKGLRLCGCRLMSLDRGTAERHYAPHRDRPFFPGLIGFITSGPVLAMAWEGPGAIGAVRALMGATDPQKAAPGTLRGDLGLDVQQNLVHGSDGPESAERELALFFRPGELVSYRRDVDRWAQGEEGHSG